MTDTDPVEQATHLPRKPGERLREAREAQGLSLDEVAARTRVPLRQLQAIEQGNYAALPSITYSVGFAKAYARAVGVDEVAIGQEVRNQSNHQPVARRPEYVAYEPSETRREPSGLVAVIGVVLALLLLVGAGLWYGTTWFRGDESTPAAAPVVGAVQDKVPDAPATPAAIPQDGQVVLTANDDVWLRIYDPTGNTLYENTLKPGDKYVVPQDISGLMINVGRPDKLQVTINGSAVPALGDGRVPIKDVQISAAALLARGTPAAAAPVASATPVVSAPRSTRPTPHRKENVTAPAASAEPNSPALNIAAPSASPPAASATPTP